MKKILLATTNKSKFNIVNFFLKKLGYEEDKYKIVSLNDINYNGPDEKEHGKIQERAKAKALSVKCNIENSDEYDLIIGIDDGIVLKGVLRPNVKDYINKILFENYLEENEPFSFSRAYCCINKNGDLFETTTNIEYNFKSNINLKVEPNSYPLSQISVPIGYDKALSDMEKSEANEYSWLSCKNDLISFFDKIIL